jgi:hypothetical protein
MGKEKNICLGYYLIINLILHILNIIFFIKYVIYNLNHN